MEEEFVPYDIALAIKELGFDDTCLAFHSKIYGLLTSAPTKNVNEIAGECLAPLYQQAFRWFREESGLYHIITKSGDIFMCTIDLNSWTDKVDTYEEAQDACLKKLIEIVKENLD